MNMTTAPAVTTMDRDPYLATSITQTSPRHREHSHSRARCPARPSGCPNCHNTSIDERRHRAQKQHFWAVISQISEIQSPDTYRTGIMTAFIKSYYPRQLDKGLHKSFNAWHWMAPRSPAMDAARDAFCLAEVGRRSGQAGLLLECRRRHVQALHLLRIEMEKPGGLKKDSVLGAAYHLGQCELWKSTASSGSSWGSHVMGVQLFVQARGPDAMASPFARTLLQLVRTVCVMDCLLNRKGSFFSEPQWIEVFDHSSPGMQLIDIGVHIGATLEQSDKIRAMKKAKEYEIVELLNEMTRLLRQLQDWLLESYRDMPGDGSPYRLVSIASFPDITAGFGDLAEVFPKVMEFSSYENAASHAYIWMCMLLLREAIHGVARQHAYPLVRAVNQDAVLTAEIDETAANLCQCVPYLLSEKHRTIGIMSTTGPLHFALNWYKQRHDPPRAAWCEHAIYLNQQGEVLGGVYDTSLNLARPMICWWMLPDMVDHGREGSGG